MKIRRKSSTCLNCGRSISDVYNYCPNCGQENTHNNLSFGVLFREFFSNYFSLDSRFGRSIKPFSTRPGHLTSSFNEGKRVMFAHPVRLYLVISLIHFTLFSWHVRNTSDPASNITVNGEVVEGRDKAELDSLIALGPAGLPTDSSDWPVTDWESMVIERMVDEGHTNEEILDSLHVEDQAFWRRFGMTRYIRVSNSTGSEVQGSILSNIPIMMFFILPIYALLLKLFYWRKGKYIHHLIHSFHIHSFTFFIFSIAWTVALIGGMETEQVIGVPLLLVTLYIFLSMKRVYGQKIFPTLLKLFSIGLIYTVLMVFSIVLELLLSLALY